MLVCVPPKTQRLLRHAQHRSGFVSAQKFPLSYPFDFHAHPFSKKIDIPPGSPLVSIYAKLFPHHLSSTHLRVCQEHTVKSTRNPANTGVPGQLTPEKRQKKARRGARETGGLGGGDAGKRR